MSADTLEQTKEGAGCVLAVLGLITGPICLMIDCCPNFSASIWRWLTGH